MRRSGEKEDQRQAEEIKRGRLSSKKGGKAGW